MANVEDWGKGRTDFSETVSGQHTYLESGGTVLISGQPIDISGSHVWISGQHIYVESGVHVIADVAVEVSSGLWVDGISGVHVYQESGAFVTAHGDIGISGTVTVESGLHVWISGQHVYVESGAHVVSLSGTFHTLVDTGDIRLMDYSGHRAYIGKRHESLVTEDYTVNEIHRGNMYRVCDVVSGLAAGASERIFIVPASGLELHVSFGAASEALAHVHLWEDVVVTNSGTPLTPVCYNRLTSGQPASLFSRAPTVSSSYDPLFCEMLGGTGKFGGQAGNIRPTVHWILQNVSGMDHHMSGGINYLYEIVNLDAAAKAVNLSLEFTEEHPIN